VTGPVPTPRQLAALNDEQRETAMRRWAVLRPSVEDGVLLAVAAREAGVPLRTVQRWLARYRVIGRDGHWSTLLRAGAERVLVVGTRREPG